MKKTNRNLNFLKMIILFSLLILNNLISQTVTFLPQGFYSDSLSIAYGLKLDSVQIYNYKTKSGFTTYTFNNINIKGLVNIEENENWYKFIEIDSLIYDRQFIIINYKSIRPSSVRIQIFNVLGCMIKEVESSIKEGFGSILVPTNYLEKGVNLLRIDKRDRTILQKMILVSNFFDIYNLSNKIELPEENNLFKFTGYSKNRKPVVLDSVILNDIDTLRFKFGFEEPFRFIKISYEFQLPDCQIKQIIFQSNETSTRYTGGLYFKLQYEFSNLYVCFSNSNNIYHFVTNDYCTIFKYGHYPVKESTVGAYIKFNLRDDKINSLELLSCNRERDGNIEGYRTIELVFSENPVPYSLIDNQLVIEIDSNILEKNLENINYYLHVGSVSNPHYSRQEKIEKINSYKGSFLRIKLNRF